MKKAFLFLLSLLAAVGLQAQTSPYTGSAIGEGEYFLYNVETGYFLSNNNRQTQDWNSHAELDAQGYAFGIKALDGGWQIDPYMGHNHSLNASNFYMDTNDGVTTWTFEPKNMEGVSNAYTISSGGTTLGASADKFLRNSTENATWQLVSAEERLSVQAKQYAQVSGDNPMDITWMIPGANFNIADDYAAQLKKVAPQAGAPFVDGQTMGNGVREIWSNTGAYDIGYQLTGLPEGVYRFTFSGYYRDGAVATIGSRHDDGTEVIRPEIYVNDVTQPVMSTCKATANGKGCDTQSGNYYVPNNIGNGAVATREGIYVNKAIKVVITDGVIDLGVRATEGVSDDWCIFDKFQLVYYGPDNIESSLAMLNTAIAEAEAWNSSNTSTAMKTALDEAITEAKGKLTSTDSDEVEAAAEKLTETLNTAKGIDVSVLKATIALAKAEGIDTAAAEEVVETATEAGVLTAATEALRTARKIKALGGAPDIYAGAAPAVGEFYFYNLGTGMWLNQGSDWCTHAAVDQVGLLVTFEESGDGFIFRTPWGTFNESPYTDTGANTVYTFQAVDGKEGVYNILQGSDLLGYNPDGKTDGKKYWNNVSNVAGADPADANYQWKLVTKAERDALLAQATKAAPVDASYLINNASLMRQPGYDMWTKEVNGGNGGARVSSQDDNDGNRAADYGYEVWNADNFKFYQTIEGLQPGLYEVSVQGFWREGDGGNQANIVNGGGALNQKAYLFANDEQSLLPNIASCPDFVPGVATQASVNGAFPNWPREAFEYFETGAYKATVKVLVEDGTLTLGVAVDEKAAGGDWVVLDNFRLAYLGGGEEINYDRALAAIEDGETYRVFTEIDGAKKYLDATGSLVDEANAKVFTFNAVKANGTLFETGWNLGQKFTNPSLTNGSSGDVVNDGHIHVGGNDRNDWERQVFFKNAEGKYAVRATNANSANWGANTYWDVVAYNDLPTAGYSLTSSYVWQLEGIGDTTPLDAIIAELETIVSEAGYTETTAGATEAIQAAIAKAKEGTYDSSKAVKEAVAALKAAASTFVSGIEAQKSLDVTNVFINNPYPQNISGWEGTAFGTASDGVCEYWNVSAAEFHQTITLPAGNYKLTGIALTRTGMVGTIYAGENSVNIAEATPAQANSRSQAATWFAAGNGVNEVFFAMPEAGDITIGLKADASTGDHWTVWKNFKLEVIQNPIDVAYNLVYNDEVIATETVQQLPGDAVAIPNTFDNGLLQLAADVETISAETQAVNVTATWAGPFEFSPSFDEAKWYNVNIRSGYYIALDETEPYAPTQDKNLAVAKSQWAFGGTPLNVVIYNRAAGAGKSLAIDGNNVVVRDGEFAWDIFANNDGFVLREPGTALRYVNQNGGAAGKLQFWEAVGARSDDGSTFRVTEAPELMLEIADIATLKTFTPEEETADVILKLTDAKVTFVTSQEKTDYDEDWNEITKTVDIVVIEDASGATALEGTGLGTAVQAGDILNGELPLTVASSWGMTTTAPNDYTAASIAALEKTAGTAEPTVINDETLETWAADPDWRYVRFENVPIKVVAGDYGDELQLDLSDYTGESIGILDSYGVLTEAPADGTIVNFTGFYTNYLGMMSIMIPTEIQEILKGDVNNDQEVDVADHAQIRDHILAAGDYIASYDINEDQNVDVSDLTGLVNIILYGNWQGETGGAGVRALESTASVLSLNRVSEGRYALSLNTSAAFNGLQMDLNVPAGMTLVAAESDGVHSVMTSQLANGKTRVLVYATDNAAFAADQVLYLRVNGQGTLTADNIVFADMNANAVKMTLGEADGINGIGIDENSKIYDLGGRQTDNLRRGINLVRKADGSTTKVLK